MVHTAPPYGICAIQKIGNHMPLDPNLGCVRYVALRKGFQASLHMLVLASVCMLLGLPWGFVRMTCSDLFPSASTVPLQQNSSRMLPGIASNVDKMWDVVQVHCQQAQCVDLHRANRHKPCRICFGARGVLASSNMQKTHE